MRLAGNALGVVWASPYTLLGLIPGLLALVTGGHGRYRNGALEFWGGAASWVVRHTPLGETTLALTLGHVILAQSERGLDVTHHHERVHVRQFALWGPLMGPLYLGSSAWMWLVGKRPYLDNHFERAAFAVDEPDARSGP